MTCAILPVATNRGALVRCIETLKRAADEAYKENTPLTISAEDVSTLRDALNYMDARLNRKEPDADDSYTERLENALEEVADKLEGLYGDMDTISGGIAMMDDVNTWKSTVESVMDGARLALNR